MEEKGKVGDGEGREGREGVGKNCCQISEVQITMRYEYNSRETGNLQNDGGLRRCIIKM